MLRHHAVPIICRRQILGWKRRLLARLAAAGLLLMGAPGTAAFGDVLMTRDGRLLAGRIEDDGGGGYAVVRATDIVTIAQTDAATILTAANLTAEHLRILETLVAQGAAAAPCAMPDWQGAPAANAGAEAEFTLARDHHAAGRLTYAAWHYHQARRTDPAWAAPLTGIAEICHAVGETDAARRMAQHALEIEPGCAAALRLLQAPAIATDQESVDSILTTYDGAELHYRLAQAYWRDGDTAAALAAWKRYRAADPREELACNRAAGLRRQALALAMISEYGKAITRVDEAMTAGPMDAGETEGLRASIYESWFLHEQELGHYPEAAAILGRWRIAQRMDADAENRRLRELAAHREQRIAAGQDLQTAVETARAGMREHPELADAYAARLREVYSAHAAAMMDNSRYLAAADTLIAWRAWDDEHAAGINARLADACMHHAAALGERRAALHFYRQAAGLDPESMPRIAAALRDRAAQLDALPASEAAQRAAAIAHADALEFDPTDAESRHALFTQAQAYVISRAGDDPALRLQAWQELREEIALPEFAEFAASRMQGNHMAVWQAASFHMPLQTGAWWKYRAGDTTCVLTVEHVDYQADQMLARLRITHGGALGASVEHATAIVDAAALAIAGDDGDCLFIPHAAVDGNRWSATLEGRRSQAVCRRLPRTEILDGAALADCLEIRYTETAAVDAWRVDVFAPGIGLLRREYPADPARNWTLQTWQARSRAPELESGEK